MVRLTTLLFSAALLTAPCFPQALAHRSWQFQEPNWETLSADIPRAASMGMNRIQLSHRIVMDAEELWERRGHEERLALVRKCITLAHRHGLSVDMWTHEISGLPLEFREGRRARLSPELWQWLDAKYEKLFSLVPDLDGLVLTFAETDFPIHKDASVISELSPVQRFVKLMDILSSVCARHHKTLMVRTFVYEPHEIAWIGQALSEMAEHLQERGNVTVMTKCVPHDWHPYYPYNPLLGNVGGLPQVVEIDLGQEYTGRNRLLHYEVEYVKHALEHARSKGVVGAVARVERYAYRALGTPNEVNLHAFSRLLDDASPSPETLMREWLAARYGEAAAPHMPAVLRPTFQSTNMTLYTLGEWTSNHSELPSWDYAVGHVRDRAVALWVSSPGAELNRARLLHPDWETIAAVEEEKNLAARLIGMSRDSLERARPHLKDEDYAELRDYLAFADLNVELFRRHALALLTTLAAEQAGSDEERARFRMGAEEHLAQLRNFADRMEEEYGAGATPGNPARARAFAEEAEHRLKREN